MTNAVTLVEQEQPIANGESSSMPARTLRAGIYFRVSTDRQADEGVSLAAQEERLRAYCVAKGWKIAGVYKETGESAKSLKRPAMERLREDVRKRRIDVVVAWKIDRLTRNLHDSLNLLEEWRKRRVHVAAVEQGVDTSTKMGKMLYMLTGMFAEFERDGISDRVKEAIAFKRKRGQVYGPIPFGFKKGRENRLEPVKEEIETVRRVYKLTSRGKALAEIARVLNDENVPGQNKKVRRGWTATTVRRILRNPVYRPHISGAS